MRRLGLDQLDHLFRCMTLASDPLHQWTLPTNDRWQEGHTAHASSEEALAQGANSVKSHVSECAFVLVRQMPKQGKSLMSTWSWHRQYFRINAISSARISNEPDPG